MNEMQFTAERVVHGDIGFDEALADLDRKVDGILAKRRWLLARGLTP